ncbi:hypothetical protein OM076_09335 [Solirubrobacter ginsenosidimutans]|uniref:Uncharacterized protein n=1 Tax=Solirubrobacter ginsenosidimutans TaxID=490573 RepID=A0A9X3S4C4_9ACTN|nr:hypothetical protein [Solirubrobacter ginsenosidimutans]MDA0160468.1 hypothetical protein [Solirubrobacter ginsenosidimutans]
MPRSPSGLSTEREAVSVVRAEEHARGWIPAPNLSKSEEARHGCDFFSQPPDGGTPHPVEVKGWGEPLKRPDGAFTYDADVNAEQLARASRDPNWRLEIVANLTAARSGAGDIQRLTLTAAEVVRRARPWRYKVPLSGLSDRIR